MTDALPRLLVAEDNPLNRDVMGAMLAGHARSAFVADGAAALDRLAEGGWDGALIDVRMPVMDGLACMRAWRAHEAAHDLARLPILACTANVAPSDVRAIEKAGFDGHLPKPVMVPTLRAVIADRFAMRRSAMRAQG